MVHYIRHANDLTKSMFRLAGFGAAFAMLMIGAGAAQASGGESPHVSRVTAHASVTIVHPAIVRTALFEENGGWAADQGGTQVQPIGESRRGCSTDQNEGRCSLVVFDMP